MNHITDIFSNFGHNPYIGILLILVLGLYILIFVLQVFKNDKVLPIAITISILLGIYLFIVTTLVDVADEQSVASLESMKVWLTIAWNVFMTLLLISLPIYVFTMVSTTFTNSRHHEGGKKLLLTSFLSLWLMTLMGILVAILFIPILIFGRGMFEIEGTAPGDTKLLLSNILHIYSYVVLATIILAIVFALLLSILHKKKHETAEKIIYFIEKIKDATRYYLDLVSKLVPYVISGVLILLFNNYGGAFVMRATALLFFTILFFLGLLIVFGLELNIVFFLRRDKDKVSNKEFRSKTKTYSLNVFAVQSAPVVYPITLEYTKMLGASEPVRETVPTLSTFMGYSMCGGFYPALVVLFTLLQTNAFLGTSELDAWRIALVVIMMIPLIMILTLGMTGVPGADVAIILGILSVLGLNPTYFFTIYLIEPLLDKFRGIGNSMGFAAATVITDRIYEKEINSLHKKQKKTKEYNLNEE